MATKTTSKTKPKKKSDAIESPLTPKAAKDALAVETKAIKRLQKDAARNAWLIGKRLTQIVNLELHTGAGFATIQDYAEQTLGIARSTAFQYMRISQAFSEEVTTSFGVHRLERGLAYIASTPEDESPKDLPTLKIRVPRDDGGVDEKPFADVSLIEMRNAASSEAKAAGKKRKQKAAASLASHAKDITAANRVLEKELGPANGPRAELSIRDDAGDPLIDIRGIPRVHAAAVLRALAKVLA